MPTSHENLFELKKQVRHAKDEFEFAESEAYGASFGSRKQFTEMTSLETEYKKLRREYLNAFYKVLEENHGVKKSDIIEKGTATKKTHRFTVLIGDRLRQMHAIGIDQKITFFIDGVAIAETQKVALPAENVRFPHVA